MLDFNETFEKHSKVQENSLNQQMGRFRDLLKSNAKFFGASSIAVSLAACSSDSTPAVTTTATTVTPTTTDGTTTTTTTATTSTPAVDPFGVIITNAAAQAYGLSSDHGSLVVTKDASNYIFTGSGNNVGKIKLSDGDAGTFTVTSVNLSGDAVDFIGTTPTINGTGSVTVNKLEGSATLDLSGVTVTGVRTVNVSDSVTFTGDLGTFNVTVTSGDTLTVAASIVGGNAVTGAGNLLIANLEGNSNIDLSGYANTGTRNATVDGDMTFTGDLGGFNTSVSANSTLTSSANHLTHKDIDGAGNVVVTSLHARANSDLSDITVTGTKSARSDTQTFTGDLGTGFDIVVSTGSTFTTNSAIISGNSTSGTGSTTITDDASTGSQTFSVLTSGTNSIDAGDGADKITFGAGTNTMVFAVGDIDAGEEYIQHATGSTNDTISTTGAGATVDFSLATAASFDDIENIVIDEDEAATFTGAQLTGETIAINEDANAGAVTTLDINVTGTTAVDLSNLTFAIVTGVGQAFDSGTDIIDIDGDANANTITGTSAVDTIAGAAGGDSITGGAGADVIDLGGTDTAADIAIFSAAATNGIDAIDNFETTVDHLNLDGVMGATVTTVEDIAAAGDVATYDDNEVYVYASGDTASAGASTATITTYTTLSEVATFLSENLEDADTAGVAGSMDHVTGDENVFVINDLGNNLTYVYHFLAAGTGDASTGTAIIAAELTLIGVVTEDAAGALVAADIV